MKNSIIIILLLAVWATGCQRHKEECKTGSVVINSHLSSVVKDRRTIDSLKNKALIEGDARAYNEVATYYLVNDVGQDFLYYAIKVANRYNNKEANFHVYSILVKSASAAKPSTLDEIDPYTKNMALYYLLKSYEMGYEKARFEVREIFGERQVVPSSSYYLNLFAKAAENRND
jgi:hypothetical protein